MHVPSLITTASAIIALLPGHVNGYPRSEIVARADVDCDDISKYNFGYFFANMCKQPPASTCLFYTRGLSKTARSFSKQDGADMTTIWELWPRSWYKKRQVKSNPLRCIMQDPNLRNTYFSTMSNAMAQTCNIFATVMDPDPNNVRLDGIWGQVELPQLQQGGTYGTINTIDAINADASQLVSPYWARGSKLRREEQNSTLVNFEEVFKRDDDDDDDDDNACGIDGDDPAQDFDEGGDYPVEW